VNVRNFRRENLSQLIFLILLPIVVFPWAVTGLSRFAGVDITKLHQPMRWFDVQSVYRGEFPLWNPNIFSGFPQFAEGESGFLYIGNILQYLPVDFSYAYTLVMLLHFALAGLLAYSCLRHFGLDKRISCGLAVVWAYSPFFMFHLSAPTILIVLAWYPAFIQLADSMPGRPLRRLGWLALLSSQILLAGSVQMAFFGFTSYFVYASIRWIACRKEIIGAGLRLIWIPLAGVILGGIVAAAQLLSTFELISYTERGAELGESFRSIGSWLDLTRLGSVLVFPLLSEGRELLHYGSSLIYLGFIPGLFFVGGLIYGWRNNLLRIHIIAAIIIILLAMGTRNQFNFWMEHIPPFDKFRYFGRFAGFASWHLIAAAGLWLSTVLAKYPAGVLDVRKIWSIVGWPMIIGVLSILVFIGFHSTSTFVIAGIGFSMIQLVVMLVLLRRAKWRMHLATAAAVFTLALAYPIGNMLQLDTGEYKRVMGVFEQLAEERPDGRYYMEGESGLISMDGHGPFFLTPYRTMKGFAGGNAASMAGLNVLSGYTPLKSKDWDDIAKELMQAGETEGAREKIYGRISPDYIVTCEDVEIDGFENVAGFDLTGISDGGHLLKSDQPVSDPFLMPLSIYASVYETRPCTSGGIISYFGLVLMLTFIFKRSGLKTKLVK